MHTKESAHQSAEPLGYALTPTCRPHLKTTAAAEYCGVSKSLLEKLRLEGRGPAYIKLSPRLIVYSPADLDAWLASARCTPQEVMT